LRGWPHGVSVEWGKKTHRERMLLTIQYPLADARGFAVGATRLQRPNWQSPVLAKNFVRFLGFVDQRPRGGLIGWGEDVFCWANHGIHYGEAAFRADAPLRKKGVFRRFYFDGHAVARFEVGVAVSGSPFDLDGPKTEALIEGFLSTELRISDARGGRTSTSLAKAADALRTLYYRATTSKKLVVERPEPDWSVEAGTPIVFVERLEDEKLSLSYPVRAGPPLRPELGIAVELRRLPVGRRRVAAWFMTLSPNFDRGAARYLRLSLLRLHAEYECLGLIFNSLRPGRISIDGDTSALAAYLGEAYSRVKRSESTARRLAGQDRLLADMALGVSDAIVPGERDRILSQIDNTTTSINARTQALIAKKEAVNQTIMNDFRGANIGGVNTGPGTINQVNNFQPTFLQGVDMAVLAQELDALRERVAAQPDSTDKQNAVAALAEAKDGASKDDKQKIWTAFCKGGAWLLGVAKDLALPIATHAIAAAIGIAL